MRKLFCAIGIILFIRPVLPAQTVQTPSVSAFYDMSLEELMNVKISVASIKALTTRESPGIVTLITEEEIQGSGARDLMDLLNKIPGFDFATDVAGIVGLGVRGNWAHEGKFLLLIDGIEMNENLYGTLQFGNHYPIENIKQIEIIRGPGSAMYGGFAEFAVINIITRHGEDINGASVSANISSTSKGISGSRSSLALGKKIKDFSFSLSAYAGSTIRSDQEYTDLDGHSFDMYSNSGIKNYYTNANLEYKNFQLRLITDNYNIQTRDNYASASSTAYHETFDSYLIELKKALKINNKISLYPKVSYKKQLPWNFQQESDHSEMEIFNIASEKSEAGINVNYDPSEKINISGGIEIARLTSTDKTDGSFFSNGTQVMNASNTSGFLQAYFKTKFVGFTIGARYNHNSLFQPSFVPRIGITKIFNKFHFKFLYSDAFRTPAVENIDLGYNIQPEKTTVLEIEAGLEITEKMMLTINAFSIRSKNTIVYNYDNLTESDHYSNYYGSGTQGIELAYKIKDRWGWMEVNYSFYSPKNNLKLKTYEVPGVDNVLLAFPTHKLNVKGNIRLWKSLCLVPGVSFSSQKFEYRGRLDNKTALIKKYPAELIADLYLNYDNLFMKGLHAGIGVYNLLNTKQYYIQPYNSLHAAIPGQSREFLIKLVYDFRFK